MMFRSNNQWVIALLLCGRLVVSGEPSHPVHFTKTTIEYSQSAQSVTIMIEAYGEDFEYAIKRRTGRGVNLQRAASGKGSVEATAYLNERFVLKTAPGAALR